MKVLIDADPIVYSVGFAGEERWYELTWWPNGQEQTAWFYSKWRVDQFIEMHALHPDEYELKLQRDAEPLGFVLSTVKRKLNNIFAAVDGFLAETDIQADEYQLYLTDGASNFRNKLATIAPYKGNRDPAHKPIYYHEIRDYMVKHWDARIIRGAEADDAVSIAQYQHEDLYSTCICTIDKDLRMVPGLHYNYLSKEDFVVTDREAIEAFYTQLLVGDPTDNIKGCYRTGAALAAELIDTLKDVRVPGHFAAQAYEIAVEAYQSSLDRYGDKTGYSHLTAAEAVLENARLLWMQRWPNELWVPPGHPPMTLADGGFGFQDN